MTAMPCIQITNVDHSRRHCFLVIVGHFSQKETATPIDAIYYIPRYMFNSTLRVSQPMNGASSNTLQVPLLVQEKHLYSGQARVIIPQLCGLQYTGIYLYSLYPVLLRDVYPGCCFIYS